MLSKKVFKIILNFILRLCDKILMLCKKIAQKVNIRLMLD